jgi:hypothetical protein
MSRDHFDEWSQLNPFVQKLSDEKRRVLYNELKSHGEVENPVQVTETHLEGGIEDVLEDESKDQVESDTRNIPVRES